MISACVVSVGSHKFVEIFLESLSQQTNLVDEILIANVTKDELYNKEYTIGNIKVREMGSKYTSPPSTKLAGFPWLSAQHALALHDIIKETKNELLLLSHHDVFLYMDAPKLLKDLLEKYNLDIVGCSLPGVNYHCQGIFPNLIFTLVKKSSLPNDDFLKGKITLNGENFDGKYLLGCDYLEPELMNLYPCPKGALDTAHLLYLCAVKLGWRWLAIGTDDLHIYNTKYSKSNVEEIKLKIQKLIYHQTGGAAFWPQSESTFVKKYEEYKEEIKDE